MAFPTLGLTNNQVHKESNRSFVYDSTLTVWNQLRDAPDTISILGGDKVIENVTLGSSVTSDWPQSSGVTYTDPDAVGANPAAKVYPDGTVIGSTDNGDYTKHPNGVLWCWDNEFGPVTPATSYGNIFFGNTASKTFPVPFVGDLPAVSGHVKGNGVGWVTLQDQTITLSAMTLRAISGVTGISYLISYLCKGRWKS